MISAPTTPSEIHLFFTQANVVLETPHVARLPDGHELVLPTGTTLRVGTDARFSPGWLRDVTLKAFEGLLNDLPTDPDELRKAFLESLVAAEHTIFPLMYVSHGTPLPPAMSDDPRDTRGAESDPLDKPAFDAISARLRSAAQGLHSSRQDK